MHGRKALLFALVVAIAATACSRLTFVKPSAERGRMDQVAPDYRFRDSADTRRRSQVRLHVGRAHQALRAGELDEAMAQARQALRLDGNSPEALGMMALVQTRLGRVDEAGGYYARAAEAAPQDGAAQNNYGAWLCGRGRATEAMPYFERALAAPGYGAPSDALANAGACAEAAGQGERAEQYLRAALSLAPRNGVALSAMADYQYRNGQYLDARAFSQRRLDAAPASAEALVLALRIEEQLGDRAAAERYRLRLGAEFPQASTEPTGERISP